MANVIKLKKGLDINLKGKATAKISAANASKVYGLIPDAFWGMKPKVVVKITAVRKKAINLTGLLVFLLFILYLLAHICAHANHQN